MGLLTIEDEIARLAAETTFRVPGEPKTSGIIAEAHALRRGIAP